MATRLPIRPLLRTLSRQSDLSSNSARVIAVSFQQTSNFTNTTSVFNVPLKKKKLVSAPKKGTTMKLKKKDVSQSGRKPPERGERRAYRKRVVLSNTNAFEVKGLEDFTVDSLESLEDIRGKMVTLPGALVDSLRAVDAFKPTQCWHMYRRPSVMMTNEAVEMARDLAERGEEQKKTIRKVIAGDRMSGKSTFLLQAMSVAFLRGWIVVNLPDANDIANASSDYGPLEDSNPTQYIQKTYTAKLLSQIRTANERVLSKLKPTRPLGDLPVTNPESLTLDKLADIGAQNPEQAWPVFEALWGELTQPSGGGAARRPPILLACDNVSRIMRDSDYLSADTTPIHAFDLAIVSRFVSYLSGAKSFSNGGAVLAASTESNRPTVPAFEFAVECAEARAAQEPEPQWNLYKKIDTRVAEALKDVEALRLRGLSKENAAALLDYFAASGVLRKKVDDAYVSEKWTLSGGGNIGELERATVRMTAVFA